jgi:hypothetical protein
MNGLRKDNFIGKHNAIKAKIFLYLEMMKRDNPQAGADAFCIYYFTGATHLNSLRALLNRWAKFSYVERFLAPGNFGIRPTWHYIILPKGMKFLEWARLNDAPIESYIKEIESFQIENTNILSRWKEFKSATALLKAIQANNSNLGGRNEKI